jgi:hypothetical protein
LPLNEQKEDRMLRARLATLTLAGGLVLSSGGCNMSERLQCWRMNLGARMGHAAPECPCQETGLVHGAIPTGLEAGGPVLVAPEQPGMMGPIMTAPPAPPPPGQQTVPMGPPPRIVPIPATTVPWQGQ